MTTRQTDFLIPPISFISLFPDDHIVRGCLKVSEYVLHWPMLNDRCPACIGLNFKSRKAIFGATNFIRARNITPCWYLSKPRLSRSADIAKCCSTFFITAEVIDALLLYSFSPIEHTLTVPHQLYLHYLAHPSLILPSDLQQWGGRWDVLLLIVL